MPLPALIPVLAQLGTSAYQAYQANKQKKEAAKLKPSNYVPPSVQEAISNARVSANASSPGYTRGLQRLRQSTANTVNNAKRVGGSASAVQQAVANADAREKELVKDLEVSDASYKAASKSNLNNLLLNQAGYEQRSQDAFNAAKSALTGSALQNEYNAVSNLGEGIVYSLPDSAFSSGAGGGSKGLGRLNSAQMRILMKKGILPAGMNYYGSQIG